MEHNVKKPEFVEKLGELNVVSFVDQSIGTNEFMSDLINRFPKIDVLSIYRTWIKTSAEVYVDWLNSIDTSNITVFNSVENKTHIAVKSNGIFIIDQDRLRRIFNAAEKKGVLVS